MTTMNAVPRRGRSTQRRIGAHPGPWHIQVLVKLAACISVMWEVGGGEVLTGPNYCKNCEVGRKEEEKESE